MYPAFYIVKQQFKHLFHIINFLVTVVFSVIRINRYVSSWYIGDIYLYIFHAVKSNISNPVGTKVMRIS